MPKYLITTIKLFDPTFWIYFFPAISTSNYNNNLIINLTAGNTISLQLFGVLSIVNLVGGGSTGASLTIIRID